MQTPYGITGINDLVGRLPDRQTGRYRLRMDGAPAPIWQQLANSARPDAHVEEGDGEEISSPTTFGSLGVRFRNVSPANGCIGS
jgi:hypothetical protein